MELTIQDLILLAASPFVPQSIRSRANAELRKIRETQTERQLREAQEALRVANERIAELESERAQQPPPLSEWQQWREVAERAEKAEAEACKWQKQWKVRGEYVDELRAKLEKAETELSRMQSRMIQIEREEPNEDTARMKFLRENEAEVNFRPLQEPHWNVAIVTGDAMQIFKGVTLDEAIDAAHKACTTVIETPLS